MRALSSPERCPPYHDLGPRALPSSPSPMCWKVTPAQGKWGGGAIFLGAQEEGRMLSTEQTPSYFRTHAWLSPRLEMRFLPLSSQLSSGDLGLRAPSSGRTERSPRRAWVGAPGDSIPQAQPPIPPPVTSGKPREGFGRSSQRVGFALENDLFLVHGG